MTRITFAKVAVFAASTALFAAASHAADIHITEWMYKGDAGEFVEFTNTGSTPVDLTGWSWDDDTRHSGVHDMSAFGTIAPGESVIYTEYDAAFFRTYWSLPASVQIIGNYTNDNIGKNDEINLYNGSTLVERLTYQQSTINTSGVSANIPLAALGINDDALAVGSFAGDSYGSYQNAVGEVGNPGSYAPVPEPASLALIALGSVALLRRRNHG